LRNSEVKSTMGIRYPATIAEQAGGTFFVQFVDLPEAFTEGPTLADALLNASEVLSGVLAFRLDEGQAVPAPTQNGEGARYITPDARTLAAMLTLE
jgi:antitoxin HicB